MLIKEYRIPLPLTVEEYRIAQLFMIAVRDFQSHKKKYFFSSKSFYKNRKRVEMRVKVMDQELRLLSMSPMKVVPVAMVDSIRERFITLAVICQVGSKVSYPKAL